MSIQVLHRGPNESVSGRVGKAFGQGLSDQIPKEVAQRRLSQGLKDFEQGASDLTPLQQYTRLAGIPGITPAMLQAIPEVLKQQNALKGYEDRRGRRGGEKKAERVNLDQESFANIQDAKNSGREKAVRDLGLVSPNEMGQPQIENTNPTRQEAMPALPFTQEQYEDKINDYMRDFKIPRSEAAQMVDREQERAIAQPEAQQKRDQYKEATRKKIRGEYLRQLGLKTNIGTPEEQEKAIAGLLNQYPGQIINNFERTIESDIAKNPNQSVSDIVNIRTNQLLQIPKTRQTIKEIANRDILDKIRPSKKVENVKKLKEASKIFAELGNQEELYNILKTKGKDGMGLSPAQSAWFAYDRSPQIRKFTDNIKQDFTKDPVKAGLQYAEIIGENIKTTDSILSILKEISQKDFNFDVITLFDYLRDNQNKFGFNPAQRQELVEGVPDFSPDWGDMAIFPILGGKNE